MENRQFGRQKCTASRGNFQGEFPPLWRSVRFALPLLSRFPNPVLGVGSPENF